MLSENLKTNTSPIPDISDNLIQGDLEGGKNKSLIFPIGNYKNTSDKEGDKESGNNTNHLQGNEDYSDQKIFPNDNNSESSTPLKTTVDISSLVGLLDKICPEKKYTWNDEGNGKLFAEVFKDHIRWNPVAKEFFYYNGIVWKEDTGGMIVSRYAKTLLDALLIYCSHIDDERAKSDYITKHVSKLGSLRNRKTMLEDSRDSYFITPDKLDKNKYLLNLQNGVLDLKTFKLIPHKSEQLLSKVCNVSYNPLARCPRWEKFIDEIMKSDSDKKEYLTKIFIFLQSQGDACYLVSPSLPGEVFGFTSNL